MKLINLKTNKEDLLEYIRCYSCNPEASFEAYDVNWVSTLFLTCLENLMSKIKDEEYPILASSLSDKQKEFIRNLTNKAIKQ